VVCAFLSEVFTYAMSLGVELQIFALCR